MKAKARAKAGPQYNGLRAAGEHVVDPAPGGSRTLDAVKACVIHLWQHAPPGWRAALAASRAGAAVRRWANRMYADEFRLFDLAEPLSGHRMYLRWGAHKAFVFGTYEPQVVAWIQTAVPPGCLAVDIGGYLGYYTLLLARAVGPGGRVLTFEPWPESFAMLEKNVALSGYRNIALENKAVTESGGRVRMGAPVSDPTASTVSIRPEGELEVEAVSLDAYASRQNLPRVGFVKIDVEGAEQPVLKGMRGLLERDRPLLAIELHGTNVYGDAHPAIGELLRAGYRLRKLGTWGAQGHIAAEPAGA